MRGRADRSAIGGRRRDALDLGVSAKFSRSSLRDRLDLFSRKFGRDLRHLLSQSEIIFILIHPVLFALIRDFPHSTFRSGEALGLRSLRCHWGVVKLDIRHSAMESIDGRIKGVQLTQSIRLIWAQEARQGLTNRGTHVF